MSRKQKLYHYYVEGQTEKKLVDVLKRKGLIQPGKVEVFNVVNHKLTSMRLMNFKYNTTVILIYDTDCDYHHNLESNVNMLKKTSHISEVICIPQNKNLEDELKYCCPLLKEIRELTKSKTNTEFKRDMLRISEDQHMKNMMDKDFSLERLWISEGKGKYSIFFNESKKIKL